MDFSKLPSVEDILLKDESTVTRLRAAFQELRREKQEALRSPEPSVAPEPEPAQLHPLESYLRGRPIRSGPSAALATLPRRHSLAAECYHRMKRYRIFCEQFPWEWAFPTFSCNKTARWTDIPRSSKLAHFTRENPVIGQYFRQAIVDILVRTQNSDFAPFIYMFKPPIGRFSSPESRLHLTVERILTEAAAFDLARPVLVGEHDLNRSPPPWANRDWFQERLYKQGIQLKLLIVKGMEICGTIATLREDRVQQVAVIYTTDDGRRTNEVAAVYSTDSEDIFGGPGTQDIWFFEIKSLRLSDFMPSLYCPQLQFALEGIARQRGGHIVTYWDDFGGGNYRLEVTDAGWALD